jgi:electron transfer flavoprotein beta subunit
VEASSAQANSQTLNFELPAAKGACKMLSVEDAGKLIELLHTEAKVI